MVNHLPGYEVDEPTAAALKERGFLPSLGERGVYAKANRHDRARGKVVTIRYHTRVDDMDASCDDETVDVEDDARKEWARFTATRDAHRGAQRRLFT